jgi:hypothetical protein
MAEALGSRYRLRCSPPPEPKRVRTDIIVVLDAMERSLDTVEGPAAEKEEARSVLGRMPKAGGGLAGSSVSSVLADASRQALDLPWEVPAGSATRCLAQRARSAIPPPWRLRTSLFATRYEP